MSNIFLNNNLYAPGLSTYGLKGLDGSIGIPGKSIYFSSFDKNIEDDFNSLKLKIQNNEILSNNINASLGDRKYQTGDLILDLNGIIYELDLNSNNLLLELGKISQNEFFYLSGISYLQKERAINNFGIAVDYINTNSKNISDVSSFIANGNINYNNTNISYIDFPHINYSDIESNGYIPFELYTTGNTGDELSLVYDNINKSFNYISNTNLVLDASDNVYINNNKMIYDQNNLGSVLTTNDIRSINLFNSQLNNISDEIFNVKSSNTVLTVTYNLSKLFKGTNIDTDNIIINLHINNLYTDSETLNFEDFDDIVIRNLNYSNEDTIVQINNLKQNTKYSVYLSLIQNGWEVNLTSKEINTQYNVAPEIKWENNSINIGSDASVFTVNASFTISANINSIDDISLVEQINGITTDVQYLDASITSFNAASEDGETPGSIQVSVNIDSNKNLLENTNSRACSIFIKKNDNTLTSNGLTINQNGNIINGVFSTTWNLPTFMTYPLTVKLPFVSKIYNDDSDDPIWLNTNCVIDWGDGSEPTVCVFEPDGSDSNAEIDISQYTHTYKNSGTYTIRIGGHIGGWSFKHNYNDASIISRTFLTSVNEWNIEDNINYVEGMFYQCRELTNIPNTPLKINFKSKKSINSIFYATDSLNANINTIFEDNTLNELTDISSAFSDSGIPITYYDLTEFNSKLINVQYCVNAFSYCSNLKISTEFKISDIIPSSNDLIDISYMYSNCFGITGNIKLGYSISDKLKLKTAEGLLSSTNISGSVGTLFNNCGSLENCSLLLYGCKNIIDIVDSLWIECGGVINVDQLCTYCSSLEHIEYNLFNGTKCNYNLPPLSTEASSTIVTNKIIIPFNNETPDASLAPTRINPVSQICSCERAFSNCTNLTQGAVNLLNMPYLGRTCHIYRTSDDPYYGTESNTISGSITMMYQNCQKIKSSPMLSSGGTRPTNIYYMWMFRNYSTLYCEAFTETSYTHAFKGCTSLLNYAEIPDRWK